MPLLSHELEQEFPELRDKIQELRAADTHFARMCEEYRRIDTDISRIEETEAPVSDFDLEVMKKQRLRVKDLLYATLQHYRG